MRSVTFPRTIGALGLAVAMALAAMPAAAAGPVDLIVNGGFEADPATVQSPDPITGWGSFENGLIGGVMVHSGGISPVSGGATVGALSGNNYGLLDLAQPAAMALLQSFDVVQSLTAATLTFGWFVNYGGSETSFEPGADLDPNAPGTNLQFRVDLLREGAVADSVAAADVLWSQAIDAPLSVGPNGYTAFSTSLSPSLLVAGQGYQLRFAAVANTGPLMVGLDDVALNVTAVPEPATALLTLGGLAALAGAVRRRR